MNDSGDVAAQSVNSWMSLPLNGNEPVGTYCSSGVTYKVDGENVCFTMGLV
jgi:hypothetical protein